MRLAFIVSIPMLHLVQEEDFHLILPHLYADDRYVTFYKDQCARGAYVVQDNSIFELKSAADWELLMRGVREHFVSEIVVPEVLRDRVASVEAAKRFIDKYGKEIQSARVKVAAVLQGKDIFELEAHYAQLASGELGLPADCIHVPFNFEFDDSGPVSKARQQTGLVRFRLIHRMIRDQVWDSKRRHHLLGLFNPYELSLYRKCGVAGIRSNDSSSCYWHSLYGVSMIPEVGLLHEKIEKEVDFSSYYRYSMQYRCFENNVRVIKQLANGDNRISVPVGGEQ